ncbi:MAG: hypothetical protein U1D30_22300 [Planctomycetota bacterium]
MNIRTHWWVAGLTGSLLGVLTAGCGEETPPSQTQAQTPAVSNEPSTVSNSSTVTPVSYTEPAKPAAPSPDGVILPDPDDESGKNDGPQLPKLN